MLDGAGGRSDTQLGEAIYLQSFNVSYEYPVYFTRDLFSPLNSALANAITRIEPFHRHRVAVFVDEGIFSADPTLAKRISSYFLHYADRLELAGTPETILGGEAAKNTPMLVERLLRRLLDLRLDRHSVVTAIGGGAMLDVVGFVAATFHRGVRLVRIPTTVLAQNDSGVGVKNGVNAFGAKNLVGSFAPPFAVLNDFDFVLSLDERDKIAGMAEAVKVALIRDAAFFTWLEDHADELRAFEPDAVAFLIRRCAELHMRQIALGGDPFEAGSARPLDYGHWAAHKLEVLSNHSLRHGEAVAIGMALDARYSASKGMLPRGEEGRVCRLLERLGLRLWHSAITAAAEHGGAQLLAGLREFREHLGGELTITLLAGIGHGVEVHEMDEAEVLRAVSWLEARGASA